MEIVGDIDPVIMFHCGVYNRNSKLAHLLLSEYQSINQNKDI